jgi:hypothetical protein
VPEPSAASLEDLTGADDMAAEAGLVIAKAQQKAQAEQVNADVG